MDGKGWSDIAYNFLECPHGYTFEGRGLNVINGANGTNAGNQSSHAICCLAGGGNPFPVTEKAGFRACVRYIADKTSAPNAAKGHRDHKATECPGNVRYDWIHQGMPLTSQEEFVVDAEAKQYFDRLIASLTRIENEHFPPIQMYVDRELPGGYIKVDEKWMTPSYYRTMKIHHNVAALLARDTSVDMEEADITAIANMVAELIVPQDTGDEVPPDVQEYANAVVEAIKARL